MTTTKRFHHHIRGWIPPPPDTTADHIVAFGPGQVWLLRWPRRCGMRPSDDAPAARSSESRRNASARNAAACICRSWVGVPGAAAPLSVTRFRDASGALRRGILSGLACARSTSSFDERRRKPATAAAAALPSASLYRRTRGDSTGGALLRLCGTFSSDASSFFFIRRKDARALAAALPSSEASIFASSAARHRATFARAASSLLSASRSSCSAASCQRRRARMSDPTSSAPESDPRTPWHHDGFDTGKCVRLGHGTKQCGCSRLVPASTVHCGFNETLHQGRHDFFGAWTHSLASRGLQSEAVFGKIRKTVGTAQRPHHGLRPGPR